MSDVHDVCNSGSGEIQVVSGIGAPKLWASITNSIGWRSMHLYADPGKGEAIVSLIAESTGSFEIIAAGKPSGLVVNKGGSNTSFVTYGAEKVIIIEALSSPFEISIQTKSGRQVAGTRKHNQFLGADEYIELGIKPVEDTVLIVTCFLAQLLLLETVI
jgi:hypothetical protein